MFYYKLLSNGNINSVERKNKNVFSPHFVLATKKEYNDFIASLPPVINKQKIDIKQEFIDIKKRLADLEKI